MADSKPVYIISDSPAEKDTVGFGFDAYAKTLAELIAYRENKTPMVVGIYGPWGSGKTTLMKMIMDILEEIYQGKDGNYRKCKTVWFQAWKHGKEDEILAALIEEILKKMKQDKFFESCKAKINELIESFNLTKFFGELTKQILDFDVTQFFDQLEHRNRLGYYDSFQKFFDRLLWTYLNWRPQKTRSEKMDDRKAALVILIDDLDRCPQDKIPEVLETIKLFMDKEGCIFVIGAANDIIEKALQLKYSDDDASKFMDKIVQVTFNLPQILQEDFESYLNQIEPKRKDDIQPHLQLIISAIKSNPRRLKRFLNNLNLLQGILLNKEVQIDFKNLLYWSIIDYLAPALRDDLNDNPQILSELKKYIDDIEKSLGGTERWDIPKEAEEKIPVSLLEYLKSKEIVDILRQFDANPEQLKQLASMSGIVQSAEEAKEKELDKEERAVGGEMKKVDVGPFLYGEDKRKETIEAPFEIDLYPVTNRQYGEFIRAGGYQNESHWSDEGKKWLKKGNITVPAYWRDEEWKQPEHPVVGVSYYEAKAYAKWAGKRLPTEKEWERAARGTEGWEYPWGNEFDKERCNTSESGIGKTTRVTRYPNGVSPVGCYDMAGNVWEWTSSRFDEEGHRSVLRGGSWNYSQDKARCSNRDWSNPSDRYDDVGFRCVRT